MDATSPMPLARGGQLAALAAAIRDRRVSAVELTSEALRRIDGAHQLNAAIRLRPAEALAEAQLVDESVRRGEPVGPLAGLPLLVKDIEDLAGLPTTFGSLLFADAPPAKTDGVVAGRLRAAGAVALGKTNVPELALEGYTANRLYGVTRNPWAAEWSPGGSSGGSAAAIAAGLAAIATATDVGGSIRIPAALCGLVGLKPSAGRIGRDPILSTPDMNNHGPLATTVADVRLLLEVLAGPVAGDPGSLPALPIGSNRLPRLVLAAPRFATGRPLPEEVDRLFQGALRTVERDLGLPVEPVDSQAIFPSGFEIEDWFRIVITEQAYALGRETIEREAERFDPVVLGYLEAGLAMSAEDYAGARRRRFRYTRELDERIGHETVLVTPTLTVEGWSADGRLPGADRAGLRSWVFNTEPPNLTGHPAISLPSGRGPNGLPFGLQVTAPRLREDLLLGFGDAWERAQPWPLSADGYTPFGL
jgi:Asp-tRNA(Asn)/Glu-tRNA(Gln) amidotransferase A subunit family amidase